MRPNREYVPKDRVYSMKIGETFHIDSGLGGSFTVEFRGIDGPMALFQNVSPGWEMSHHYRYPVDKVHEHIFIYVHRQDTPQTESSIDADLRRADRALWESGR